jgi:hypothetical protein
MTVSGKKRLDGPAMIRTFAFASGTSWPSKAGSANRAGSGHGGSGPLRDPDVRDSPEPRTSNAPEDETDLMPGRFFVFTLKRDNSHPPPPTMTALTSLPGIRVRAENPNHHLWNNHGTWFLHYTVHPTPFTKERVRRSLGTKDLQVARERRDAFFTHLASETTKPAGTVIRKAVAA